MNEMNRAQVYINLVGRSLKAEFTHYWIDKSNV